MSGFISVTDPGSEEHAELDFANGEAVSRHESTDFYNEVVQAYNESKVGAIIMFPLPAHLRYGNLRNTLKGRGLGMGDVSLSRQEVNSEGEVIPVSQREVKLKKLTTKSGKLFDSRHKRVQDSS